MLSKSEIARLNHMVRKGNDRFASIFSALSDKNRCRAFRILLKKRKTPLCVGDIAQTLGISIPAASQHLKILETSGLLTRIREGQKMHFTVRTEDPAVSALAKSVLRH